ncbi:MAG: right-handed parallel beta-helix repeat-containing protein [Candidatus Bathyarchaeum sp.]|nr:MAG: right-handed parallel beta-helix repeat-containing protein [Candidatus Bathyarchaeum sp.]
MRGTELALTFILTLLLFSAVAGGVFVDLAVANFFPEPIPAGIRINSDGTVEGTDSIHRSGNVYTLADDIHRTIVVLRDGIVLDGAGYTLQGNGDGTGVFLQERNGVTIKNLKIRNFYSGIKFTWLNFGSPTSPRSNRVSGNTITNNTYGITFYDFSSGDEVSDNYIADNTYGVISASNAVFRNNQFRNNDGAISESINDVNDIDTSNTVNDKPIYYWVEQHDRTVPSDAGWVALKNCRDISVQDLNLEGNADGILLCRTTDSTVNGNVMTNNLNGITLKGSSNNVISDNQIRNNKEHGIRLEYNSGSNIISRNEIVANTKDGVHFESSTNNSVTENQVMENNGNGIFFYSIQDCNVIANNITLNKDCGISFGYGPKGTIIGNYISRNEKGIWINSGFENTITFNTIAENDGWGIELEGSQKNNVIHHNNFINNNITEGLQVRIASLWTFPGLDEPRLSGKEPEPPQFVAGAANVWDDDGEGNYWSDYFTRYPNATEIGNTGIGDTPFYINPNNMDNNPLTNPVDISTIPEFPSWIILPLFLLATLFSIVIRKKLYGTNKTERKNFIKIEMSPLLLRIVTNLK